MENLHFSSVYQECIRPVILSSAAPRAGTSALLTKKKIFRHRDRHVQKKNNIKTQERMAVYKPWNPRGHQRQGRRIWNRFSLTGKKLSLLTLILDLLPADCETIQSPSRRAAPACSRTGDLPFLSLTGCEENQHRLPLNHYHRRFITPTLVYYASVKKNYVTKLF